MGDDLRFPEFAKDYSPHVFLLYLLGKLEVVGLKTHKFTLAAHMLSQPTIPSSWLPLAVTGLSRDYLEFVPWSQRDI